MTNSYRLGIDIGGTFSDFALVNDADGSIRVEKTLTSAHAPEESVMRGIGDLSGAIPDLLGRTSEVIHATTLVTNTILERKGAKTGLLTTGGFRDILELAREVRYDIYDMFIRLPEPLVSRRLRLGVPERVLADGAVLLPLDEAAVRQAAAVFRDEGVGAVAVSFLHSYRNSVHERRAAEIPARGASGGHRVAVARGVSRAQGIRTHLDHRARRLCERGCGGLSGAAGGGAGRARLSGAAFRHAVERRHRDG